MVAGVSSRVIRSCRGYAGGQLYPEYTGNQRSALGPGSRDLDDAGGEFGVIDATLRRNMILVRSV